MVDLNIDQIMRERYHQRPFAPMPVPLEPMTPEEFASLLAQVTYKDWRFSVWDLEGIGVSGGKTPWVNVEMTAYVQDSRYPHQGPRATSINRLHRIRFGTAQEMLRQLLHGIEEMERHEREEFFQVGGRAPFHPHVDTIDHERRCTEAHLEARREAGPFRTKMGGIHACDCPSCRAKGLDGYQMRERQHRARAEMEQIMAQTLATPIPASAIDMVKQAMGLPPTDE